MRLIRGLLAAFAAFAGFIACADLRSADDEPAPSSDAGARSADGNVVLEPADATTDGETARPPCPAPCLPERLSTLSNIGPLILDETTVYFGTANVGGGASDGIFKCPKTGCSPTTQVKLAAGRTDRIALANDRVFWGQSTQLAACTKNGCNQEPDLIVAGQKTVDEVVSDGTTVVWHTRTQENEDVLSACRAKTCVGPNVVLVRKLESTPKAGIGIGDGKVFWSDVTAELRSCPLDVLPCAAPATLGPGANDIVVHGADVLWTQNITSVVTCPLGGCNGSPTRLAGSTNTRSLAVDAYDLYWRNLIDKTVERCPRKGCDKPEIIATGVESVAFAGLALDDEYIYWAAKDGLWRRRK